MAGIKTSVSSLKLFVGKDIFYDFEEFSSNYFVSVELIAFIS